jgi:two-component system, cell cycle sensor histidine kinase and response regulator CckA
MMASSQLSLESGDPVNFRRGRVRGAFIAVFVAAAASAALLLSAVADPLFTGAFLAGMIGVGGLILFRARLAAPPATEQADPAADVPLIRAALDLAEVAAAVTDAEGGLICANDSYAAWFGSYHAPAELGEQERITEAVLNARRDGGVIMENLRLGGIDVDGRVSRIGFGGPQLLWTFTRTVETDVAAEARRLLNGEPGRRMGEAGLMGVVADAHGRVIAANPVFLQRSRAPQNASLVDLLGASEDGYFYLANEGKDAAALRILQVPLAEGENALTLFVLLDDAAGAMAGFGQEGRGNVNALLDILPLGLALANIDGRFVYLNKAFRKAAGLGKDSLPAYPGDLVVSEDKAVVSDLVRRFGHGPASSSDIAVRLKARPDEPIGLTIAGIRGLGEAVILLSLKDNSEEDRLKRQVAQATKMQAVGQLAGGVAHDFNNILTAIIGHCDLMLMRHAPGDSDYDDIQQIRSNSNRAAGLTRQLLAFSRQQTLRPQVLQLPDVISEVSNLLKRLLGETVTLQVKHGRNLGAVRADPGQLEQVIVNLAVNARDAMTTGGTLTLHTFSVSADDVRQMASDILPIADYTALRVSDTGAGIPAHLLGKIYEPFFTTKEVGKGTGLGLSTVYGIVKQSGGWIFAESELGKGTSFTIYLPVHRAEAVKPAAKAKAKTGIGELWGTGTILLVEDETMVRAVAERALTRHGYTVLTAENGEEALEILESVEKVDLMISDVVMPTMDGPTTVREARKIHPELPILFISGYAEEQLRKSIDIEKVAFLAKPFSVQTLAEAARDALLGQSGTK